MADVAVNEEPPPPIENAAGPQQQGNLCGAPAPVSGPSAGIMPSQPAAAQLRAEAAPAAPASPPEAPSTSGPPADDNKPSMLPVDLDVLLDNVKCSICMGVLRNTHAVSVCMHRFCKECIERWLRSQKGNNCPQCRVEFSSRRDCRADPQFDHLLAILFGDLDAFEAAIAPSATTLERAKAIGLQIMKAQEERRARPPPPPPPRQQQQPAAAAAVPDAVVHITVSGRQQQPPKQQQQSSVKLASPSSSAALKRSRSAAVAAAEEAKRQRTASPELVSPNGSKYKGVRFTNGRYQARIKLGRKESSLGQFDSALEAAQAYDMEQLRRFGGKAQLNLPHLRPQYSERLEREGSAGAAGPSSTQPTPQLSRDSDSEGGAMAEEDPHEQARQRARQLAVQRPARAAFAGVTPVAHVRLEAAGRLEWAVRHLACPAGTSVGELKQTMAFGLSQQHGTAAFARPLGLAVQNDLDSSANFDAICTADADGSLLLRDHVTIRELVGLLEDCTEELVLEYTC